MRSSPQKYVIATVIVEHICDLCSRRSPPPAQVKLQQLFFERLEKTTGGRLFHKVLRNHHFFALREVREEKGKQLAADEVYVLAQCACEEKGQLHIRNYEGAESLRSIIEERKDTIVAIGLGEQKNGLEKGTTLQARASAHAHVRTHTHLTACRARVLRAARQVLKGAARDLRRATSHLLPRRATRAQHRKAPPETRRATR